MNLFQLLAKGNENSGKKPLSETFSDDKKDTTEKTLLRQRHNYLDKALERSGLKFGGEEFYDAPSHHSTGILPGQSTHHFHMGTDHVVVHAKKHPEGHVQFKPSITSHIGGKSGHETKTTHHDWTFNAQKAFEKLNHEHYKGD